MAVTSSSLEDRMVDRGRPGAPEEWGWGTGSGACSTKSFEKLVRRQIEGRKRLRAPSQTSVTHRRRSLSPRGGRNHPFTPTRDRACLGCAARARRSNCRPARRNKSSGRVRPSHNSWLTTRGPRIYEFFTPRAVRRAWVRKVKSARGCAVVLKPGKFSPIAKFSQIADRNRPCAGRRRSKGPIEIAARRVASSEKNRFVVARDGGEARASDLPRARQRATRLSPPDLVSRLGARERDGRLHPRQVSRR